MKKKGSCDLLGVKKNIINSDIDYENDSGSDMSYNSEKGEMVKNIQNGSEC